MRQLQPVLETCLTHALAAVLLWVAGSTSAWGDTWTNGRDLFAPTGTANCAQCHSTTAKSGKTATQITSAIATVGSMQIARLQGLSASNIAAIADYLSTPRHATLSPASYAFGDAALGLSPQLTNTFTLTSDGDSTRVGSAIAVSAPGLSNLTDFGVGTSNCAAANLAVGSSCTTAVTFRPSQLTAAAVTGTLTLAHDGFGAASSAGVSGKGVANLELLTAGPLAFNSPLTVTSAAQTVSVANRLNGAIRYCLVDLPASVAPKPSADYNLVGLSYDPTPTRCATLAAPGASPTQSITFTPTVAGPRLVRFTVERDGGGGTWLDLQQLVLEGNAGPLATFTSAGLVNGTLFGSVRQDINAGAASPVMVVMGNSGAHDLRVTGVSLPRVAGSATDEYFASGCTSGATTLAAGQTCSLSITFDPAALGVRSSVLHVDYVDATVAAPAPQSAEIQLKGTGFAGPQLQVSDGFGSTLPTATLIDFGRQNITIKYPRNFTLRNIGSDEALVLSLPAVTPNASGFSLVAPSTADASSPACAELIAGRSQTLAASEACSITLRFLPTQVVTYSGQFGIHTQPATSSIPPPGDYRLNLGGEGANDMPVLLWKFANGDPAASVDFALPATAVASASPPTTRIRLTNSGRGAAALLLLNLVGRDALNFRLDQSAAGSCHFDDQALPLLEGTSCDVAIVFAPQTAGAKLASLQLLSTGTTPQPIQITGQAAGPIGGSVVAVTLLPATVNFNAVRAGAESAPVTVTLANSGNVATVVTALESDQPFLLKSGTCPALPFTLAIQAMCTMTITFVPATDGQMAGALRVKLEGQATAAATSALSGDGIAKADLASGGCSLSAGESALDPTICLLAVLAALALYYRRRQRQREVKRTPSGRCAP